MSSVFKCLALLPALSLLGCSGGSGGTATDAGSTPSPPLLQCGPPEQPATSEACLREELGIPEEAERVVLLSQSSHLDWDWQRTFDRYLNDFADDVLLEAFDLLEQTETQGLRYYYSIAEIGFLRASFDLHPERHQQIHNLGQRLRIVGGGITSPDNLLPRGESLIRDYLLGKRWVDSALGLPIRQAWMPDDFGHDTNLPILLEALGLQGVGIARIPGVDHPGTFAGADPPDQGSLADELLDTGLDFIWQAADGSEVIAHWMPQSYCQGDRIDQSTFATVPGQSLSDANSPEATNRKIQEFVDVNGPGSRTPYIFVPIGCDFSPPKQGLMDYVAAWNDSEYPRTRVWATVGTFDHYVQLLNFHRDTLEVKRFDPTPYWTGFYATRPLLKGDHLETTQALLAAEVFGVLADGLLRDEPSWASAVADRNQRIQKGWEFLVPGNHHDYITGTVLDSVYQSEQIPRLAEALTVAKRERDQATAELAEAISSTPQKGELPVAIFNQLGFAHQGLVELAGTPESVSVSTVRGKDDARNPVQQSADGKLLFLASVPSMGYTTVYLGNDPILSPGITVRENEDGYIFENSRLRATISRKTNWGLTSLVDLANGKELIAAGQTANELVIYRDGGGIYRFGHELVDCRFEPEQRTDSPGTEALDAELLEAGPVRARLRTQVQVGDRTYTREYILVVDEPYLRLTANGSAPPGTSVLVQFPFAGTIDELVHGTPTHWDSKLPQRFWPDYTFEATHDFIIPRRAREPLAALFHAGIPAWAARTDGMLVGALWRNVPTSCEDYGADGSDEQSHNVSYAIRVPGGISDPTTGEQLREALAFHTPLRARFLGSGRRLPATDSLVTVSTRQAIAIAAKAAVSGPNELILRLYQPTNDALDVMVTTTLASRLPPGNDLVVRPVTALETDPMDGTPQVVLEGTAAQLTLHMPRALATVSVGD